MGSFLSDLRVMCSPSKLYFGLSVFFLMITSIQNFGYTNEYHLGCYGCSVSSTLLLFTFKLLYVLFWTWILNLICKDGHRTLAWILVLFPIILMFVLLGLLLVI